MNIDPAGIDWLGRGWLLLLAFTAAVVIVAALRKPCRYLFGTERAFQLWLLPPMAMLASQLPHAAAMPVIVLSPVVATLSAATGAFSGSALQPDAIDWRACLALIWLTGIGSSMLLAVFAQVRYRARLRGATIVDLPLGWPVLRAVVTDVGPALMGAWRSRIVLPSDFESRYSATEQTLILAHELMHARRRDGCWCLLAQMVAIVFWFHPLAWWALSALRHDQELACDAAVLREHDSQRLNYANAMLKTQPAVLALPVGCSWSPRHPLTERIAMLKLKQPGTFRRRAGGTLIFVMVVCAAGAVYAASPSTQATAAGGMADHYTLKIDVAMGDTPASMHFTRCLKPNEFAALSGTATYQSSWQGRFAVAPAARGELEIRSQIDTRFERAAGNVRTQSGKPIVRTMPGQQATIVFGQVVEGNHLAKLKLEDNTIKIDLTASIGCDSATLSSTWLPASITQREKSRSARDVAEAVASKAGFVLENPEALDRRPVSLNFDRTPAVNAIPLIAEIDGKQAVFRNNRVRFQAR